jgi:tyrosyl-tRNA synthetase
LAQRKLADNVTELVHGCTSSLTAIVQSISNLTFAVTALQGARLASSVLFETSVSGETPTEEYNKDENRIDSRAESLLRAIGDHPRLRKVSRDDVLEALVTKLVASQGLVGSHGELLLLLIPRNPLDLAPSPTSHSHTSHAWTHSFLSFILQRPTDLTRVTGKAKALLQAGGLYLNNARLTSLDRTLQIDDFMDERVAILRAGKEHLILELL